MKESNQSQNKVGLQEKYFSLTHGILKNAPSNSLIFIILKLIENLQILYFMVGLKLGDEWNKEIMVYPGYILNYISFDYLFQMYSSLLYSKSLFHIGLTILIIIWMIIISNYVVNKNALPPFCRISLLIIAFLMILYRTILQIPFMTLIVYSFAIANYDELASNNAVQLIIGLGVINLILFLILQIYITISLKDHNPFSQVIFAGETLGKRIFTLVYKLGLVIYPTIDQNHEFEVHFIIIFTIINLLWIIGTHLQSVGYFHKEIKRIDIWFIYFQFWFCSSLIFFLLIQSQIATLSFFLIMSVLSNFIIDYIQETIKQSSLKNNFILMKQASQIESHILILIKMIDTVELRSSRISLIGYLNNHIRNCKYSQTQCCCYSLKSIDPDFDLKFMFFSFVVDLLKNCLKRVDEQKKIHLLLSFIYQNRQKNRFQAIYSIVRTLDDSNVRDRLQFYRQINIIEGQMVEDDLKHNQNQVVDINKFFLFNVKIVEFEDLLEKCSNDHTDFWKEMLELNINLKKIAEFGALITQQKDHLKQYFSGLQQLNANNAHSLVLYGKFLTEICNDETENSKYLQKACLLMKNLKQSTKIDDYNEKYNDNAKTSIIIISGNQKQLGTIVQTNNFVHESLGYYRRQLISQNVALIMPKIFGDSHNRVLGKYLSTSSERFNGKERMVPVLCKNGYMQPCYALTKALPNLLKGIQIVGFISIFEEKSDQDTEYKNYSYILYNTKTQIVMGLSKTCHTEFGIPPCLAYGNLNNNMNELKIKNLFSISLQKLEQENTMTQEIVAELNTKNLSDEFIIMKNQSSQNIVSEKETEVVNRGKSAEVAVNSTLSLVYQGTSLRIISFYDIDGAVGLQPNNKIMSGLKIEVNKDKDDSVHTENEELKDLKDFKNFISIKNEPKAIRSINYACIILIVLICVGIGLMSSLWFGISENNTDFIDSNEYLFVNRMMNTEILFEVQKIFMNENDRFVLGHQFNISKTISELQYMIEKAKDNLYLFMPLKLSLIKDYDEEIRDYYITSNGNLQSNIMSVNEVIALSLTKVQNIIESNLTQLSSNPLNYGLGTVQNYEQIKYTTIFSLLPENDKIDNSLIQAEKEQGQRTKVFVYVISVFMVLSFLIWIIISLPKVLSVTLINNRVMSLFGLISGIDIESLIRSCLKYSQKYLSEAIVDEGSIMGRIHENEEAKNMNFLSPIHTQMSQMSPKITQSRMMIKKQKDVKHTMNAKDFEDRLKTIQSYENGEKGIILMNYTIISTFLLVYILFSCFYTSSIVEENSAEYQILDTLSLRAAKFRQIKLVFVEYLISQDLQLRNKNIGNINNDLIDEIYQIQRNLLNFQYSDYYSQHLSKFNTKSLCSQISSYKPYKIYDQLVFSRAQCEDVGNGILKKGIKTAIVTSLEEIRSYISTNDTEWQSLNRQQITIDTIEKYKILQKYIETPLIMIIQMLKKSRIESLEMQKLIFMIVSGTFFLFMILFWRIAWRFYINNLNEKVWRTKGMLNLIPTKIITDNELLKNQFTSGELEKVVK